MRLSLENDEFKDKLNNIKSVCEIESELIYCSEEDDDINFIGTNKILSIIERSDNE